MSENVGKMSAVVVAVMMISFVVGVADARAEETIRAKVPFAFTVGNMHFAAGSYSVRSASDDSALMEIVSADGTAAMFAMTMPASPERDAARQPELVFTRMGGEYRLSRLVSGDGEEREFVAPPRRGEHDATGAAR